METVTQALEKMGRATYREVAARLDIEPVEALNMLREQRDQGLCDFSDGGWFIGKVTGAKRTALAPAPKPVLHGVAPDPVDPEVIRELLAKNGAMDTAALALAVNRNGRGMTSAMRALERQGVVVKNGQGKGVTWSLPAAPAEPEPVPVSPAAPAVPAFTDADKPLEQFVNEIPAFTERHVAGQVIPTVQVISREIRRTKNKLASLEKLRDAVRVVGRHKNLVNQLVGEADHAKTQNS
ncbi:Protein of uncharacterised function (DUF1627) [Leclercia adecarboxylata]|uniref:Protein of uncharacterized function (DUF1627) n=1 Tax=Leclercia adecarboxylata TaxID=83655 RepID=A0A4U9HW56_9ENTR|nr:DUF1627 domain-containing protein [Leclercia adecarboxylata]KFC89453.1 hypothetical protein GLAD_04454 [Leclercia adecarboxylata ATCC 23216 = NBRC 102595]PHH04082.1 hypothetical protein CRX53_08920 [Leclercia adecarboxylata]UBH69309.1 DUF1627 domain-containing protein [Leclercia adecarboxylata]SPX62924.1 Protein of uncharacterised function (DUF1627) [Leclercia adecarboxylata]VTP67811.1 Protein of uncharacterised function (DUF1627) [Leclercia adecarboxylata]